MEFFLAGSFECRAHCPMQGPQALARTVAPMPGPANSAAVPVPAAGAPRNYNDLLDHATNCEVPALAGSVLELIGATPLVRLNRLPRAGGATVLAADFVTPEAINFMARYGRGLICLALTEERLDHLRKALIPVGPLMGLTMVAGPILGVSLVIGMIVSILFWVSYQGILISQRTPKFNVRLGVAFQVSCT